MNTPELPKKTKGALTAERILNAAEALFASQGYDGTSLRQIAEQTGIKEPGLYNYFPGKQALYEAVLHRALNPMAEVLNLKPDLANSLEKLAAIMSSV